MKFEVPKSPNPQIPMPAKIYYDKDADVAAYVVGEEGRRLVQARPVARRLDAISPRRSEEREGAGICRIYVAPEDVEAARACLGQVWQQPSLLPQR